MKLGLSSYSLYKAMKDGGMTILDSVRWVAENGGQHIEIVPLGFDLTDGSGLPEAIREEARRVGIDVSNYAIGANFIDKNGEELRQEIERVKSHVDIANRLGVKLMRHDVASRPAAEATLSKYIEDLPVLVEACREIADYAAGYGITTSVENHGFHVQGSDRTLTLVQQVARDNFKTTLDVGNFICLDEDPVVSVAKSVPYMSMLHVKDFYIRPASQNPGDGWLKTAGGRYFRGAVVGQGELDIRDMLRIVKESGYDGYVSVEFEGLEECKWASKTGMDNVLRIWQNL